MDNLDKFIESIRMTLCKDCGIPMYELVAEIKNQKESGYVSPLLRDWNRTKEMRLENQTLLNTGLNAKALPTE